MTYRGYEITKERTLYGTVIWVETDSGPCDVDTIREARETIDRIIAEKQAEK